MEIKQVDSTDAGDAVIGAVLKQISDVQNKQNISFDEWRSIVLFANRLEQLHVPTM